MKVNQSALQLLDHTEDVTDGSGDAGGRTHVHFPAKKANMEVGDTSKGGKQMSNLACEYCDKSFAVGILLF